MGWPQRSSDRRRRRSGRKAFAALFNATTTSIACGSEASIDDLADNAFTAEAWIRADGFGENNAGRIFDKSQAETVGFAYMVRTTDGIRATVYCATTNAQTKIGLDDFSPDSIWHHLAFFFDDAGDRKIYVSVGGVWVTSYTLQTAGVDAVLSDAAFGMFIGNNSNGNGCFDGPIGWARISDNDRYNHGTDFTPPPRTSPPLNDANTVRLFKMDEGTGTNIGDSSTNAQDATLSNGTWIFT